MTSLTLYLLDLTLQVSLLIGAGLAVLPLLRRQPASLRHWVLSVAIACAMCVPVVRAIIPDWTLAEAPLQVTASSSPGVSARPGAQPSAAGPSPITVAGASGSGATAWSAGITRLVPVMWVSGMVAGLLILAAGLARLAWLGRRARPLAHPAWVARSASLTREFGIRRPVRLLETDRPGVLAAWGWFRPRVMVPAGAANWPADCIEAVLRHELAHIARGDWAVQIAAETLRAINWFNPLVWVAPARLRFESELACDDIVLDRGIGGAEYAAQLLTLARSLRPGHRWAPSFPAPAMARSSSLERRVTAMLNTRLSRAPMGLASRMSIVCLAAAITLPVASLAVFAQGAGSFGGSILDPMSKMVPNTKVVLTNATTGAKHEVVSDASGRFEFTGLPAGDYQMEARRPGFAMVKLNLTVGSAAVKKDVSLAIGSLQESITIQFTPGQPAPPRPAVPPTALAPRPPVPCTATATGGNVRPPMKLRDVKPVYPEHLAASKAAGLVVVEAIIAGDGTVRDVRIIDAPHADLGKVVVDAVSKWVFEGTRLNCEPIDVKMKVNATFVLGPSPAK